MIASFPRRPKNGSLPALNRSRVSKCLAACIATLTVARADSVVTLDGRTFEGQIELQSGALKIGAATVPFKNIRSAKFSKETKEPAEAKDELTRLTKDLWVTQKAGVLSWDGSYIARPAVAMNDTKVSLEGETKDVFLSTINTAAIFFGRISLADAFVLRKQQQPGVLLTNGEFLPGKVKSLNEGVVQLESILLGRKLISAGTEAAAIWLRKPKPVESRFTLRTADGSLLLVKEPGFVNGMLHLNGVPFRDYRIAQEDLLEISNGNAADVLTLAWTKVDNAPLHQKPLLLTTVSNVGRTLELRRRMQAMTPTLQMAKKRLSQAETAKNSSQAERQQKQQQWRKLQDTWRAKNQKFWKTNSDNQRMVNQARVKLAAVTRAERTLTNAQRTLDKYARKLETFDKDAAKFDAKPAKDFRRKRDGYLRPVERAKRAVQQARQKLDTARRNNEKYKSQAEPLPARMQIARQDLDQAKREADQAMQVYRKSLETCRAANAAYNEANQNLRAIQQEYSQAENELQEIEAIRPTIPEQP